MNKKEAKNRIEELRKQVEYHAKRYYDDDEPEISDFEYDMLMVELRNLEKNFPEFNSKESLSKLPFIQIWPKLSFNKFINWLSYSLQYSSYPRCQS